MLFNDVGEDRVGILSVFIIIDMITIILRYVLTMTMTMNKLYCHAVHIDTA